MQQPDTTSLFREPLVQLMRAQCSGYTNLSLTVADGCYIGPEPGLFRVWSAGPRKKILSMRLREVKIFWPSSPAGI